MSTPPCCCEKCTNARESGQLPRCGRPGCRGLAVGFGFRPDKNDATEYRCITCLPPVEMGSLTENHCPYTMYIVPKLTR